MATTDPFFVNTGMPIEHKNNELVVESSKSNNACRHIEQLNAFSVTQFAMINHSNQQVHHDNYNNNIFGYERKGKSNNNANNDDEDQNNNIVNREKVIDEFLDQADQV